MKMNVVRGKILIHPPLFVKSRRALTLAYDPGEGGVEKASSTGLVVIAK